MSVGRRHKPPVHRAVGPTVLQSASAVHLIRHPAVERFWQSYMMGLSAGHVAGAAHSFDAVHGFVQIPQVQLRPAEQSVSSEQTSNSLPRPVSSAPEPPAPPSGLSGVTDPHPAATRQARATDDQRMPPQRRKPRAMNRGCNSAVRRVFGDLFVRFLRLVPSGRTRHSSSG